MVRRLLRGPSSRKNQLECGSTKTVPAMDLTHISQKLPWDTLEKKQSHIPSKWTFSCTKNQQKFHPQDHGFRASSPEIVSFNEQSLEFQDSLSSEVHDVRNKLYSVHWRDKGNRWRIWWLGKLLGLSWRRVSSTYTRSTAERRRWYHWGQIF